MTNEPKEDPELFEDNDEGAGDDAAYDQVAVETVPYDHSQFELPEDYIVEDDDDA